MDSEKASLLSAFIQSPVGCIELTGNMQGIQSLRFTDHPCELMIPEELSATVHQVYEYFEGTRTHFDLMLNPVGTPFMLRVWHELMLIPYGKTVTYGQLSEKLGLRNGARAVGLANGANPISIIVPCHRVIGTSGKLTGYAGGLWRKEWLLRFEKTHSGEGLFAGF